MPNERRRRGDREDTLLPAQVSCNESEAGSWTQTATVLNVSPFGARLRLSHPTEPGRLLYLQLSMPRRLRSYDHDEDQYKTWALVRHLTTLPVNADERAQFEIGVAFTGKSCPAGYDDDPAQRFELVMPDSEGLPWQLQEFPAPSAITPVGERRSELRHEISQEVMIEIYDADGNVYKQELATTTNISRHGMALLTTFHIVRGRYIRVRSAQYKIAVIAAVRRLAQADDGRKRLHLEFVDQQWPALPA